MYIKLKGQREEKINFTEVHQYTEDIARITFLRDKCSDINERKRYNNIIEIMQLVMQHINDNGEIKI